MGKSPLGDGQQPVTADLFGHGDLQPGAAAAVAVKEPSSFGPERSRLPRFETRPASLPDVSSPTVLRKAVTAVHCHPTSGEQTILTRRVFNALILDAQEQFAALSEHERAEIRRHRGTPIFNTTIGRLRSMIGQEGTNATERIYGAMEQIYQWSFRMNVMGDVLAPPPADAPDAGAPAAGAHSTPSGEVQTVQQVLEERFSRFLSQWGKGSKQGRPGQISYEFPHDVLLLILDPKPYAQIDMRLINAMGSAQAIALYENCVRYFNTRHRCTAVLPVEEWISLICGVGKYQGAYKEFKRCALLPAMGWLEKVDSVPFTVELREVKGPRGRVIAIQFKLLLKGRDTAQLAGPPPTWPADLLTMLVDGYGMDADDIAALARAASEAEVREAVRRERLMFQRKAAKGDPVVDRTRYLQGIIRNVQGGQSQDVEPEAEPEEVVHAAVRRAQEKVAKDRELFVSEKRKALLDVLNDRAAGELEALRSLFQQYAASRQSDTIDKLVRDGWKRGNGMLNQLLCNFLIEQQPDIVTRLLPDPRYQDFDIWKEMRSSRGAVAQ